MTSKELSFGEKAINYFLNLNLPSIPSPVSILNPYTEIKVIEIVNSFFNKFYDNGSQRIFILGINPGRFGGGITGVPFTDPFALKSYCGIHNDFPQKRELSSTFIYQLIDRMGGPRDFFSRFYLTALFPLALIKNGKNINYYDTPELYKAVKEYIYNNLKRQSRFGAMPVQRCLWERRTHTSWKK